MFTYIFLHYKMKLARSLFSSDEQKSKLNVKDNKNIKELTKYETWLDLKNIGEYTKAFEIAKKDITNKDCKTLFKFCELALTDTDFAANIPSKYFDEAVAYCMKGSKDDITSNFFTLGMLFQTLSELRRKGYEFGHVPIPSCVGSVPMPRILSEYIWNDYRNQYRNDHIKSIAPTWIYWGYTSDSYHHMEDCCSSNSINEKGRWIEDWLWSLWFYNMKCLDSDIFIAYQEANLYDPVITITMKKSMNDIVNKDYNAERSTEYVTRIFDSHLYKHGTISRISLYEKVITYIQSNNKQDDYPWNEIYTDSLYRLSILYLYDARFVKDYGYGSALASMRQQRSYDSSLKLKAKGYLDILVNNDYAQHNAKLYYRALSQLAFLSYDTSDNISAEQYLAQLEGHDKDIEALYTHAVLLQYATNVSDENTYENRVIALKYYQQALDKITDLSIHYSSIETYIYQYAAANMAQIYTQLKNIDKAIECYEKYLKFFTKGNYYFEVAELYLEKEDYTNAIARYEKSIACNIKVDESYDKLLQIYKKTRIIINTLFDNVIKNRDPDKILQIDLMTYMYNKLNEKDQQLERFMNSMNDIIKRNGYVGASN